MDNDALLSDFIDNWGYLDPEANKEMRAALEELLSQLGVGKPDAADLEANSNPVGWREIFL